MFDQQAGIGQAQAFVVRVLANAFFQQRQGFPATLEALQQARLQQQWRGFVGVGSLRFEQLKGFFRAAILLQEQGLAE
ncbi:hypothetical protein D9M68_911360 [compost metagenome]